MSRSRIYFPALATLLLIFLAHSAYGATSPNIDLDWYGYVKLDAAYDQNLTSHGNFAMWVQPQSQDADDEQFNMTHKQTRFGVALSGKGYENVKLGGNIEFDFYGSGGAENKAALLLRHAYLSVGFGNWQLVAGQYWDLISPLNPSTLNYPVLWGCGNIGYRRPQVRLTYNAPAGDKTKVTVATGFFRTIGDDLTPTFALATEVADGSDDGTDAGVPTVQGLFEVQHQLAAGTKLRAGVSGMWGKLKAEGTLGSNETYETQGVVGHFSLSFPSGFGFLGEYYSGANLEGYFGGIANKNTINGVNTSGGWVSAWFKPHPKVALATGFGFDDPDEADLPDGSRIHNQCVFGNITYSPVSLFKVGFEVSQWETEYQGGQTASALRAQTSFILNF
jgi:hypothetical protein